jgi:hypothetical protein
MSLICFSGMLFLSPECCVTNGYTDNAEKAFHGNHWKHAQISNDFHFPDPLLLIDWRK